MIVFRYSYSCFFFVEYGRCNPKGDSCESGINGGEEKQEANLGPNERLNIHAALLSSQKSHP